MKRQWLPALAATVALMAALTGCYYESHYVPAAVAVQPPPGATQARPAAGYRLYKDAPRFAATDPARVKLLKSEPQRESIKLGEVWIRPSNDMDRYYVEGVLREKAAQVGADALVITTDGYTKDYERRVAGIAIRYRR